MIAILSPAKTLDESKVDLDITPSTPQFLDKSEIVMNELKKYEVPELCTLMKINEDLGLLNFMRNQQWKRFDGVSEKPCVLSFKGEAYRGLDAKSFTKEDLEFCDKHLRILSGLYGILRPLDGVKPYRLEMGTKFNIGDKKNLYEFWRDELSSFIINELNTHSECVLLNLASDEYYKSLDVKNRLKVVTPVFKERRGFSYKVVTVYAKKARGMMVNYIVKNRIDSIEQLKKFDVDGYEYNKELSTEEQLVFTRE